MRANGGRTRYVCYGRTCSIATILYCVGRQVRKGRGEQEVRGVGVRCERRNLCARVGIGWSESDRWGEEEMFAEIGKTGSTGGGQVLPHAVRRRGDGVRERLGQIRGHRTWMVGVVRKRVRSRGRCGAWELGGG